MNFYLSTLRWSFSGPSIVVLISFPLHLFLNICIFLDYKTIAAIDWNSLGTLEEDSTLPSVSTPRAQTPPPSTTATPPAAAANTTVSWANYSKNSIKGTCSYCLVVKPPQCIRSWITDATNAGSFGLASSAGQVRRWWESSLNHCTVFVLRAILLLLEIIEL